MTVLPTLAYFRRHALPVHFLADLGTDRLRSAAAAPAISLRARGSLYPGTPTPRDAPSAAGPSWTRRPFHPADPRLLPGLAPGSRLFPP